MAADDPIVPTSEIQDFTGMTLGYWTIQEKAHTGRCGGVFWLCKCQCGTERLFRQSSLCSQMPRSCGCVGGRVDQVLRIKNPRARPMLGSIICAQCSLLCKRTGPTQKFCFQCSEERANARKLKWAREHPVDPQLAREHSLANGKVKRSRLRVVGEAASVARRTSLEAVFADETGMAWVRRFAMPFTYAASKNHAMSLTQGGHIFLREQTKVFRQAVQVATAAALVGAPVVIGKVWLELIIQKPDHRGDAVNILDQAIDGIKHGCGVDDRWFCIRRMDWEIIKRDPQILIGIGQECTEEMQVCSYCGSILPLSQFFRNRSMPQGRSRACNDCEKVAARRHKRPPSDP